MWMSDWYHAKPKFVNPASGSPLAVWLLCWIVNRSKSRSGLKPASLSVSVSLSSPRSIVAVAVGVVVGFFCMHGMKRDRGMEAECRRGDLRRRRPSQRWHRDLPVATIASAATERMKSLRMVFPSDRYRGSASLTP